MGRVRQVLSDPVTTFLALAAAGVCCVPEVLRAAGIADTADYLIRFVACCVLVPMAWAVEAVGKREMVGIVGALGALLLASVGTRRRGRAPRDRWFVRWQRPRVMRDA